MADAPSVAVLLASYNGAEWIGGQIESILDSRNVRPHIFLSDDGSLDGTIEIARQAAGERLTLLPSNPRGSAAQNFIRLVSEASWDRFDYVALSDQDDIWLADKLSRAIAVIQDRDLAAYSSDVMAFWPNGRRRYIRKSQSFRRWDYLFESAGPGNTFVFPNREAAFLRQRLNEADSGTLQIIERHDWLFYAYFREASKRWLIDAVSGLDYRQHEANVVGAAKGVKAKLARLDLVNSGWYRSQILAIGDLIGASNSIIDYVRRPQIRQWWKLALHGCALRRRFSESLALSVLLAMMAMSRKEV